MERRGCSCVANNTKTKLCRCVNNKIQTEAERKAVILVGKVVQSCYACAYGVV